MRIVEFCDVSGADDNRYATFVSACDIHDHYANEAPPDAALSARPLMLRRE
jgi:hypothetical protein